MKASEKSDNAVRSTFDKVAKEAGKAKDKVKVRQHVLAVKS